MSSAWDDVYACAQELSPPAGYRIANLIIAAAARQVGLRQRELPWNGATARAMVDELALSPLPTLPDDPLLWQRLADLAFQAAPLGLSPEGMHTWTAAYQRASTSQKALGAYATHNVFASVLARITMAPLARDRTYRIVDPSVGSGNLLLAAIEQYGRGGTDEQLRQFILGLHGVELDPRARELCCLLIWLFGADSGVTLEQVAGNIRLANALTLDWWSHHDLFDVLLMNPPWESLRHKITDDPGEERAKTLARASQTGAGAPGLPPLFSAQGTGDRNLFKLFVELAPHLIREGGRLGALLPAAFASDAGLTDLRERYFSQFEIARWTGYENRRGYFPIDGRYKFGLLAATRSNRGTQTLAVRSFALDPDEVDAPHIALDRDDILLIGRQYHIVPELARTQELEVLRVALANGTPLFDRGALGKVVYRREVDLSLHKAQFYHVEAMALQPCGDGTYVDQAMVPYVPLLEGRSVGAYDCFQKSWVSGSGRTAVWQENQDRPLEECTPQYVIAPVRDLPPRVALCDVTASTNTRTVIATRVPRGWRCGNTAPVLEFETELKAFAALGVMNSMVFDWVARRLVSGLHLNKFILEGLVWPELTDVELEQLAFAAWSLCTQRPRAGLAAPEYRSCPWAIDDGVDRPPLDALTASAAIEVAVARGLGLTHAQLAIVYDPNRQDRRGFWRYFDSEPVAAEVAKLALAQMELAPPNPTAQRRTARRQPQQMSLDGLAP
jgi:hypothetical protein